MDAVRLGPLLLPTTPLLLLVSWWLGDALARWLARRGGVAARPGPSLLAAAVLGLVAARVAFVVRWWPHYHGVTALLDVRDGGFDALAGWLAALLVVCVAGLRRAALRRPVAAGFATALLLVLGGQATLRALQPPPRPLPQLRLVDLQGNRVSLSALRGRPLVINLWATWCPPCRRELPMLLEQAAQQRDARIVLVDQGDTAPAVRALLRSLGHAHAPQVLLDGGRALGAYYDAPGYPTTLFIGADGMLRRMYVGAMSAATLQQGIEYLQRGAG